MADLSTLAAVTADIHRGRFQTPPQTDQAMKRYIASALVGRRGPLIDASFIYQTYLRRPKVALYEDHPSVAPPWDLAYIGYLNEHGNANVTLVEALPWTGGDPEWSAYAAEAGNSFDGARWELRAWFFSGGQSGGRPIRTVGPIALTRVAVHEGGEPLDIHWVDLVGDGQPEQWDWSRWTALGVYSFMGARNIEVVDAPADRATRRRCARLGHQVSVLAVTESGRRGSSGGCAGGPLASPLHSVRGHFAHYGACCSHHEPRGLLFGRHTARVWVPQHAVGDIGVGTVDQVFVPEGSA